MVNRFYLQLACLCISCLLLTASNSCLAQQPNSLQAGRSGELRSRVSPVLEIEVVDPGRDARGNPAVVIREENGETKVEIPPSLIVHRYYYTGDRSFRGPELPGGPSIVVAQNPVTGKQCYLELQMLPGSPVVHYTSKKIEYDFGDRAVIVTFPKKGDPTVGYRNGRPISETAAKWLGVPIMKKAWNGTKNAVCKIGDSALTVAKATGQAAGGVTRPFTLPMQHLARAFPGHSALTDPNLKAKITEQSAENRRAVQVRRASAEARLNDLDFPVVR